MLEGLYNYSLLKVVSHYGLSVLSMSAMGFQRNVWLQVWVGEVSSIQFFVGFFKVSTISL